jgi:hypothetical protein
MVDETISTFQQVAVIPLRCNLEIALSYCHSCPLKDKCEHFASKYNQLKIEFFEENKDTIKKQLTSNTRVEMDAKAEYLNKYLLIKFKNHLAETNNDLCVYERQFANDYIQELEQCYKLSQRPQLRILAEELVKLKIIDFKVGNIFKRYGILKNDNQGENGGKLASGIYYSLDVTDKIMNLIEKMDKMAFGEKNININVGLPPMPVEELFGARN